MSRNMWILAAVLLVIVFATIYQEEIGGGIDRPWAACQESMVQQWPSRCTSKSRRTFAEA